MAVRTWRERRTHEKHGDYIIYYDQYKANGVSRTDIYIDIIRKGKTIRQNR